MDLNETFCTLQDAAVQLGVERHTVWRWIKSGRLPAQKVGNCVLIERGALEGLAPEESDEQGDHEQPTRPEDLVRQFLDERGLRRNWVARKMGISDTHLNNTLGGRYYKIADHWWRRLDLAVQFTPDEKRQLIDAGVNPEAFEPGPLTGKPGRRSAERVAS